MDSLLGVIVIVMEKKCRKDNLMLLVRYFMVN